MVRENFKNERLIFYLEKMFRIQSLFFFMIMLISNEILFSVTQTCALDTKESDHLALLAIKSKIVDGPEGSLSSWNASFHFCQWEGVTCGRRHKRVTSLNLSSRGLAGSLSPFVGNLSFLRVINLQNNTLEGIIPPEIGLLFRLEQLLLTNNSFHGIVPSTLSNCTNLTVLKLSRNKLVGRILQQVTSLLKLVHVSITHNNFTGGIPPSIGNLTSIEYISAHRNKFGGRIPYAIGHLKKLGTISLGATQLHGTIPPSFYNLSLLSLIYMGENQLVGSLPQDIGLKLPKLQDFVIYDNQFTGHLPVSISNCSELVLIDIGENQFHGKIAIDFRIMPNLLKVGLINNALGSGEPDEMNFIASLVNCSNLLWIGLFGNQLSGQLPSCVGNLSTQLSRLEIDSNFIYGSIPRSIMNLVKLETLTLNNNQFTGTIPRNIGNLQNLKLLYLGENRLTGNIPESVSNLSHLFELYLENNRLEGAIPTTLGNCQSLIQLDISRNNLTGSIPRELFKLSSLSILLNLSRNHLSGSLPLEIGKLHNIINLDLSENELDGEVPSSIGGCNSLVILQLEGNFFQGLIPSSFGSLTGIQYLDLSRNKFSGKIPIFMEKFSLNYLNLSFNDFEGEIPINGVFTNATLISVAGNSRLCGGLPELQLPKCSEGKNGKKMSLAVIIVIPILCSLVGLVLVSYWLLRHKRRSKTQPTGLVLKQSFLKCSYETLFKATNGFSSECLIGMGSYSRVYKGVLEDDGATIAVKVLNLAIRGASKSFLAECEAWRNIRHRNLVKIITACSSIDFQGNDFKALVYEFMPNGSVESWLHPTTGTHTINNELHGLSLLQRINIATDVANAIDYLHHRGEIPIIHCDLKPSNILLDEDMVAHVGDFGLARFLLPHGSSIMQSSSIGIRGTIGYTPSEYGLGNDLSVEGDVYSFGILLLEMMTGKRPTESMFENGLNLHNYARNALPDGITDIVDPIFVIKEENETKNSRYVAQRMECMISVVKIGIACSVESAKDRMNISDVVDELQRIAKIISQHEIKVAR